MALDHSLTHSILINLFIKVGLNLFSPTSPAKYCFALRTSRHMFDWFYGGTCLVPRPQYFAAVIRFGSRGPGRKVWPRQKPKN